MTSYLVLKETNRVKVNVTIGGIADLNQKKDLKCTNFINNLYQILIKIHQRN